MPQIYWAGLLLAGMALVLAAGLLSAGAQADPLPAGPSAPVNEAFYKDYRFGPKDQVLDMGVQPMWVPSSPLCEAMQRDLVLERALSAQGLRARFHPFRKGADGNFFILRGDLDGLVAGDLPTLAAAASSEVVVATLVHQGFASVVARPGLLMENLGHGQAIGYPSGSVAHWALFRALTLGGMDQAKANLVPMELTDMLPALRAGRVAAVSTWEPFTTMILHQYPGATVVHRTLYLGFLYFSRAAVQRHPRAVREMVAAQIRAMDWMRAKRANLLTACRWALQAHRRLAGQEPAISLDQYAALVRSDLLDVAPVPDIPEMSLEPQGSLHAQFEFLKDMGLIPTEVEFAKVRESFDRKMIFEVLGAPEEYQLNVFDYRQ